MSEPKSILLFHRKNMEWYNKLFVPYMRKEHNTKFIIICNVDQEEFRKRSWVSKKDTIINISDIDTDASNVLDSEEEIYTCARKNEKKYNITYLRDSFLQDRSISVKLLDSYSLHPTSKVKAPSLLELTKKQNYYFNFFLNHILENKVDLVISRPDDMMAFSIITIASNLKIPVTVQQTTRINGYLYWQVGPYCDVDQVKMTADKLRNIKTSSQEMVEPEIASHAIKYNDIHLKRLSFSAMVDGVIYTLKDRLNWLIKDIKRGKIGKRIPMIPKIFSKISTHFDHRYYQKIFESDIDNITSKPFIFFGLPMEPEYATHSLAKNFNNVHAIVQQAAISLPSGYNLVIKEHSPNIGLKPRNFYKSLMKIPNIKIANYLIRGVDLVDKADSIMTFVGSSALEAAERGKMAIVFGDSVEYLYLPNILLVHSLKDLPEIIHKSLDPIAEDKKEEIIKEFILYKRAFIESGYYAPDTPLFDGKSQDIKHLDFLKSIDKLFEVYNLQRNI